MKNSIDAVLLSALLRTSVYVQFIFFINSRSHFPGVQLLHGPGLRLGLGGYSSCMVQLLLEEQEIVFTGQQLMLFPMEVARGKLAVNLCNSGKKTGSLPHFFLMTGKPRVKVCTLGPN